jgi:hypothetical protein
MKEKAPDLRVEVYLLAEELNDVKTLNGLTMKPHKKFRDFSTLDYCGFRAGILQR